MTRLYVHMMNVLADTKSERGAAGVEYGIMVAAIAAVIVLVAFAIGSKIGAAFETVNGVLPVPAP